MIKTPTHFLLSLGLATGLVACGGGGSSNTSTTSGSFSLQITDAPVATANQVVVRFNSVSVKPVDDEEALLFEFESKDIDLLTLTGNAAETLLDGVDLPEGDYEWIRLGVQAELDGELDSFIELSDGSHLELRIPSGAETGLKVNHAFTMAAGSELDFTVDFDLNKSVTNPPGQAGAMLRPVLRIVATDESGSISGVIDSNLIAAECDDASINDGAVYAYSGADITPVELSGDEDDAVATALVEFAEGEYSYEIGFLEEGEYTVAFTCDNTEDEPEAVDESIEFVGATNTTVEDEGEAIVDFEAI